jgi:hypothetical protein
MRSTHSQRLERWLGAETIEQTSRNMRGWYGPPIALAGVPGEVYATGDGDFIGHCRYGSEATAFDLARDMMRRLRNAARISADPSRRLQLNSGFASLAAMKLASRNGHGQTFPFSWVVAAGPSGPAVSSWWPQGFTIPLAGTNASAAPGGRVPVGGTDGGHKFINPPAGMTTHFAGCVATGSVGFPTNNFNFYNNLLLYDRIFDVAKSMSSTATEAVTGVPNRYQSTTATDLDYVGGNFAFIEIGSNLGIGAHNWTVCQYKNQANATATFPSAPGNSAGSAPLLDHVTAQAQWFIPVQAGDVGVKALSQIQCSASITGAVNFVIGHPLAWMPLPLSKFA